MKTKLFKPPRTEFEVTDEVKRRYIKRKAEEEEANKRLDWYYRHPDDEEPDYAPSL